MLLLTAFILMVGGLFHLYGAIQRPDLRFKLLPFGKDLPNYMLNHQGVIVSGKSSGEVHQRLMLNDDPRECYDEENSVYMLDVDCWVTGGDVKAKMQTFHFEFPRHPNDYEVRLDQPNFINFPELVPLTIAALYKEEVRIVTYLIDADLTTPYVSRTLIDFPDTALGARAFLENTAVVDKLNAKDGYQLFVATGIGLTEVPYSHRYWDPSAHEVGARDPAMQTSLGMILAPAYQPEWREPYAKFEFHHAANPAFIKPYGNPCLVVSIGNPYIGWYTLPPEGIPENTPEYEILSNDDAWHSVYLMDINLENLVDRRRFGEDNPEFARSYDCYLAISNQIDGDKATSCASIGWPYDPDGYDNTLSDLFTESDTSNNTWWFQPREGLHKIAYPNVPMQGYPFVGSDRLMGFILLNADKSASMLLQPDVYTFQEYRWTLNPRSRADNPSGCGIDAFLGVIPVQDNSDVYAFSTDDSQIIVCDESGEILQQKSVSDFFLANNTVFKSVVSANNDIVKGVTTSTPKFPAVVQLVSDYGARFGNLVMNEHWDPAWGSKITTAWSGLAGLWFVGLFLLVRHFREKTFISYADHETIVAEERKATEYEREKHSVSAHEIRNPLNAIRGFAKLLAEDASDPDQRESAEVIVKETDRLDGILKRLLDYSRELKLNLDEISLRQWWADLKLIAGEMAGESSVNAVWSDPPDRKAVFDPELMQQVFVNLYKNAIEASPESGTVKASLDIVKNQVVLRIEDEGPGITTEDADKAFHKFHTTKVGGTGVGLPFSKRIVNAHGGDIYFDPEFDTGAAIVVKWPVQPPEHIRKAAGKQ